MIYVDRLFQVGKHRWAHMTADSINELHDFADKLGLRREWYQGPPKTRYPHYDIRPTKYRLALQLGATVVPTKNIVLVARALLNDNRQ